MELKIVNIFSILLFITLQNVEGLDKRLQNANVDFLNFEGHRNSGPVTTAKPVVQNVNLRITPTPTTTVSRSPVLNQQSGGSNTGGQASSGAVGKQNPTGQNLPTQSSSQLIPGTPNANPALSKPAPSPQSIPQSTPNTNPVLPKPTSNSAPPQPAVSWSSIVSGNKPASTSKPHIISPENTPKSAQNLQPIDIGGGWPLPGGTTPKPVEKLPEIMSDQELKDLSEALLSKDTTNPARLITINYQGKTTSFSKNDVSPSPLLSIPQAVWDIPTVAKMKALYDNYEQDVTVNEHVTALEKNEENDFLDAVMASSVMRQLMSTLRDKGVVSPDAKQQRDVLKSIWFTTYSRGQGKIGSSGFEHIFLSEIKNNEVSGLHNWLYFSSQETANNINYLGYMKKIEFGGKGAILKFHFLLKDIDKPVSTMFVGTSPELEMALYSLCFLTRVDRSCPLSLGGETFNLRTHNFRYRGKNMIGSAFPEIN